MTKPTPDLMRALEASLGMESPPEDEWSPPDDETAEALLDAQVAELAGIDWEDEDDANEALARGRRPLRSYLMRPSELDRIPPVRWLIEGILPLDALAVLFAEPGAGKTFVALDWAGSLSVGLDEWEGYALRPDTRVLYILSEGAPGLRGRRDAWQAHHAAAWRDEGLTFIVRAANFMAVTRTWGDNTEESDFDQLRAIVAELRPHLLVVDTMSRAIPGVDENDAAPISLLMERADQLRELGENMTVLFLHHTNKAGRYRGSSVIHGQVDTMIEIDEESVLRVKKQKDGQEPVVGRVELLPVESANSVVPIYHAVLPEPDTETNKRYMVIQLLQDGPLSVAAILKAVKGGRDQLRVLLDALEAEGVVTAERVGNARQYALTP